jgi:hypothetical protein
MKTAGKRARAPAAPPDDAAELVAAVDVREQTAVVGEAAQGVQARLVEQHRPQAVGRQVVPQAAVDHQTRRASAIDPENAVGHLGGVFEEVRVCAGDLAANGSALVCVARACEQGLVVGHGLLERAPAVSDVGLGEEGPLALL